MDITEIRRRAQAARRLMEDADLTALLSEIEEEATAAFLVSRGDPALLTAAFEKVRAVQTLRNALQTRLSDEAVADKREQKRGPHAD